MCIRDRIHTNNGVDNADATGVPRLNRMTMTVPSTGSSASIDGNNVDSEYVCTDTAIMTRPTSDSTCLLYTSPSPRRPY